MMSSAMMTCDIIIVTSHHLFFVADTGWRSRRLGLVDICVIFIYILGGAT